MFWYGVFIENVIVIIFLFEFVVVVYGESLVREIVDFIWGEIMLCLLFYWDYFVGVYMWFWWIFVVVILLKFIYIVCMCDGEGYFGGCDGVDKGCFFVIWIYII